MARCTTSSTGVSNLGRAASARFPALRYGRQYFREISGDGVNFGYPLSRQCTLAYSRILDTQEVIVALNLDAKPRSDWITVDRNLSAPGTGMADALNQQEGITVEDRGSRAAVRVVLPGHGRAILTRTP